MVGKQKSRYSSEGSDQSKRMKLLKQENDKFYKALEFYTYNLVERSSLYDGEVAKRAAKWESRLQVQLNGQTSDQMDLVSIIGFLDAFKMACDNNTLHDGATL